MKPSTSVLILTVTALLLSGGILQAQSTAVKTNIPFEFHVGNTILPAGTYTIRSSGPSGAISFSNGKGQVANVLTDAVPNRARKSADVAEIVFTVYGDKHYFVTEVRWSGYDTARGVGKYGRELEIARLMPKPTKLMIAAR